MGPTSHAVATAATTTAAAAAAARRGGGGSGEERSGTFVRPAHRLELEERDGKGREGEVR